MLSSCGHMAATLLKKNEACKLVKFSQSDDDRGDHDEAEKGEHAVPGNQKIERRSESFEEESGKPEEAEGREERKDQRPPSSSKEMREEIKLLRATKASEKKIRGGSGDARSSSDEFVCSDVSWQVVRKKKETRETGEEDDEEDRRKRGGRTKET